MSLGYNSLELTLSVPMQTQAAKIDNIEIKMHFLYISHTKKGCNMDTYTIYAQISCWLSKDTH